MRVAIAGATGTVGRHVRRVATERGHDVVPLSRATGHDLTRDDLTDALEDVDCVIDVVGIPTLSRARATAFFEATSRQLQRGGAAAGVGHLVTLSIVGIDGVHSGYYGAKLAHERAVSSGVVPFSLLRASQFHEFAEQTIARGRIGSLVLVPTAPVRPIAAEDVAERLVDLAEDAPSGRVDDLVGPRDERLIDMVRSVLAHDGRSLRTRELRLPGPMGAAMASGVLRGTDDARRGRLTFGEWLQQRDRERDSRA